MTFDLAEGENPRLLIDATALRRASVIADTAGNRETGGVLLGFRCGNDVCVIDAIEVPAKAASRTRYVTAEADRNAVIEAYQQYYVHADTQVGYVGTWHSHPGSAKASARDRRALMAEAADAPDLVGMLVLYRAPTGWKFDGYVGYRRPESWVTPVEVIIDEATEQGLRAEAERRREAQR